MELYYISLLSIFIISIILLISNILKKMIYTQLSFDFQRDLHEVSQDGFVDLNDAIITNQIPSDLSTPEESFNDMPVNECIGRPSDVFDGMEYGAAVNSHIAAKEGTSAVSPEQGDGV